MISKRACFSLHLMAFLAERHDQAPIVWHDILDHLRERSHDLSLSPSYVKRILQDLARSGLVTTMVGPKGGYALARPPREMRVTDFIVALDGPPTTSCCLDSVGTCDSHGPCCIRGMILDAQELAFGRLGKVTAARLADKMFRPSGRSRAKKSRSR